MSRRPHHPTVSRRAARYAGLLLVALPLLLAGCKASSPSEPTQQPGTPPGTGPSSATFNITVSLTPSQVPAGSTDPVTVGVRVVRADNGQPPPTGTTVVLSASAGAFGAQDGPTSVALETSGGRATASYFPPATQGTGSVVIQARLENSIGQAVLAIAEPATFFINALEPNTGNPSGGDQVSILGGGFETPVRVTFDGTPAQVLSVAPNRIRVITPPSATSVPVGSTSTVDVAVTINLNEELEATDTLSRGFTYTRGGTTQQPAVFSVTPASGPNEGGTRVTINGDGFESPIQVFFGSGTSATTFTGVEATVESVTTTRLVVVTPPARSFGQDNQNKTVNILVKNVNSGFSTIATSAFQYGTKVIITAAGPGSGPFTGGTRVTIHGQGFEAPVAVSLGGRGQQVLSVTGTEIVIVTSGVPVNMCPADGQIDGGTFSVTNINTGDSADSDIGFTFLVPLPIITSVSPASGPQGGGTTVTIGGQGFQPPVRVLFSKGGEDFSASVQGASSTQITVRSPGVPNSALDTETCDDNADGTAGERFIPTTFDVQVQNLTTGCDNTFSGSFTYIPTNQTCRNDVGMAPPPAPPQCSDGIDNDGDGLTDFNGGVSPPGDPQCTSDGDDSEAS